MQAAEPTRQATGRCCTMEIHASVLTFVHLDTWMTMTIPIDASVAKAAVPEVRIVLLLDLFVKVV